MKFHRDDLTLKSFVDEVNRLKAKIASMSTKSLKKDAPLNAEETLLDTIEDVKIYYNASKSKLHIERTRSRVDADGSPHAYNPANTGLDYNANAKDSKGRWVGIATRPNGVPYIQDQHDIAPGYYVSTTAYELKQYHVSSPDRYINSEIIPYCVLPPQIIKAVPEIVLGSRFIGTNMESNEFTQGMVADVGPTNKFGEFSICSNEKFGLDGNPKNGGTEEEIISMTIFLGIQYDKNYPLQPYGS